MFLAKQICTGKMAHTNDERSWSDLPSELVGHVLGCLPAHTDRIRCAAVCRHWCISARHPGIPPPLPWLVLSDGAFFTIPRGESFQIPNSAGFHSCSGEWLVFSSEETCSLVNTFSKATLWLPDLYCFNCIDEPHQVINGHVIPNTVLNTSVGISVSKVVICSQVLVYGIYDSPHSIKDNSGWIVHTSSASRKSRSTRSQTRRRRKGKPFRVYHTSSLNASSLVAGY